MPPRDAPVSSFSRKIFTCHTGRSKLKPRTLAPLIVIHFFSICLGPYQMAKSPHRLHLTLSAPGRSASQATRSGLVSSRLPRPVR